LSRRERAWDVSEEEEIVFGAQLFLPLRTLMLMVVSMEGVVGDDAGGSSVLCLCVRTS